MSSFGRILALVTIMVSITVLPYVLFGLVVLSTITYLY